MSRGVGAARDAQALERRHEVQEIFIAVVARPLDVAEHLAERIARGKQRAGDRGVHGQRAVAERAEERFGRVRDAFELLEAKESARALDRVHHAEDAREHVGGVGVAFERQEIAVQAIQRLIALDQEFLDDLVHVAAHAWISPWLVTG